MRLYSTLNLRRIGGKYMIVKVVGGKANMTDVITLNETAALLWERFSDMDFTEEEMAECLCGEYEVDIQTARKDVHNLLAKWKECGMLSSSC